MQKKIMIKYYLNIFLQKIGYRKVWYFPSRYMPMADFCKWEYRPDLRKGEWNSEDIIIKLNKGDI